MKVHLTSGLKAMTVAELLVAMLVGSIVISIAIGIFLYAVDFQTKQRSSYDKLSDCVVFYQTIKRDLQNSKKTSISGKKISIKNNLNEIIYKIEDEYILRYGVAVDTFKIAFAELYTNYLDEMETQVASIEIEWEQNNTALSVFVEKQYELAEKLNLSLENGN